MNQPRVQSKTVAEDDATDRPDARERKKGLQRGSANERKRSADLVKPVETTDAQVAELTAQLEAQQRLARQFAGQSVRLDAALQDVLASTSWQITRPMRMLGRMFPWLARAGRRSLKLGWWIVTGQFWRIRRAALPNADPQAATLQGAARPARSGVPAVLDISPIRIGARPAHAADDQFWQYPCLTERDAYERHLKIADGTNVDPDRRMLHTYLGLPWATYIDRRVEVRDIAELVSARVSEARMHAQSRGLELAVHTVCQHYAWWRIGSVFAELGITDLHLSHCTEKAAAYFHGSNVRVHSWPLYAVNVEDPDRTAGLQSLKPTSEKRYLASFIGSHMAHYLSEVRLRLAEAARRDGGSDLLVELTEQWHFDPVVYGEQVKRRSLDRRALDRHAEATYRYNQVLSDSVFSLCPEGAGPNSLRLWESLAIGAIPVAIFDDWIPPTGGDDSPRFEDACIVLRTAEVGGLFDRLRRVSASEIEARRQACIDLYKAIKTKLAFEPR